MAYTPTEWRTGDVVTSSKLNKIEEELGRLSNNGVLISTATIEQGDADITYHLGVTYNDILHSELCIIIYKDEQNNFEYYVVSRLFTVVSEGVLMYVANLARLYPSDNGTLPIGESAYFASTDLDELVCTAFN